MKSRSWYKIHKWLSFIIGIFFIIWTISGIVMILPYRWFQPEEVQKNYFVDYLSSEISPADVVATMKTEADSPPEVLHLQLIPIADNLAYQILLSDGSEYLIDAKTGEEYFISPEVAESVVRTNQPVEDKILSIERLDSHNYYYPLGELPVYRVVVEGGGSNTYYVSVRNGAISQSTNLTRLRAAITSLHTFELLRLLSNRDTFRKSALLIVSLLAIGVPLTGYYLFFVPYLKKKSSARS